MKAGEILEFLKDSDPLTEVKMVVINPYTLEEEHIEISDICDDGIGLITLKQGF